MIGFSRSKWWKILTVLLLIYVIIGAFLLKVPALPVLHETIRNLHFHVPMWFGMYLLFLVAAIYSLRFLWGNRSGRGNLAHDLYAEELSNVGLLFGILGLITGAVWARYTWGEWWSGDVKQNMAAIVVLLYLAYTVLRSSMDDPELRARVASVWNVFSFVAIYPILIVIPNYYESMHPGSSGNEGFVVYDKLDVSLRFVFYPAVIGWTLLGLWMASLRIRAKYVVMKRLDLLS